MTPTRYRECLAALELSQRGLAPLLHCSARLSRARATDAEPIPEPIAECTQMFTYTVSLHALGRRYERCSEWEDVYVLRDLAALTRLQPEPAERGQDRTIATQSDERRGTHADLTNAGDTMMPVMAVRTWVPSDL